MERTTTIGTRKQHARKMASQYFSERERGQPRRRTLEQFSLSAWKAMLLQIQKLQREEYFGKEFPEMCPDGLGACGTDPRLFDASIEAEFPGLATPLVLDTPPLTHQILDLLEYLFSIVSKPERATYHNFFGHWHYDFDVPAGRIAFMEAINRVFARQGLAYNIDNDGRISRLIAPEFETILDTASLTTSDQLLDGILETARKKYASPDLATRQEAVEELWDAWERLKTLVPGVDKKDSITKMLDLATTEPTFRKALEDEAATLTRFGNIFMIRHSETDKIPLSSSEQVDYFFQRLFCLVRFLFAVGVTRLPSPGDSQSDDEEIPF